LYTNIDDPAVRLEFVGIM